MLQLNDTAEFIWMWSSEFFLITDEGNYVWSDPGYGGDNTIRKSELDYGQYCDKHDMEYGRSKGTHIIGSYTGNETKIVG